MDENAQPIKYSKSKNVGMQPPSKRQKVAESGHDCGGEDNEHQSISPDEYAQAVSDLKLEWKKGRKGRSQAVMKDLMERTASARRQWITQDRPLVSEVVSKFPVLKQSRMVRIVNA